MIRRSTEWKTTSSTKMETVRHALAKQDYAINRLQLLINNMRKKLKRSLSKYAEKTYVSPEDIWIASQIHKLGPRYNSKTRLLHPHTYLARMHREEKRLVADLLLVYRRSCRKPDRQRMLRKNDGRHDSTR